jgi:PAS domain S-box-containing protein
MATNRAMSGGLVPFSRYEHSFLEALFAAQEVGLALIDSDQRYIRVNDALARVNGLAPEEHVGKGIGEVLPDFADALGALLTQVLESRQPIIGLELAGPTPADPDPEREFRASFFPLVENDASIGVAATLIETTEAAKKQRELLQQAHEIYEDVVQDLVVALLALENKDLENVERATRRALDAAKAISSSVLVGEFLDG